jgi:flagellar basal-body rod protein FlgF
MTENPAFKSQTGMLDTTGRQLDVAINGDGWFAVQADPQTGEEALTRAGNFKVDEAGFLVTPGGHQVLGDGGPINLPPFEQIEIGTDGTLSILPVGQDAAALAVVDRIRLVNPPMEDLFKGKDGLVRLKNGAGAGADVDPGVRIVSGALESSNVSAVESLVKMIDLSRRYEMQVKMMKTADRAAEVTTQMMRL